MLTLPLVDPVRVMQTRDDWPELNMVDGLGVAIVKPLKDEAPMTLASGPGVLFTHVAVMQN